MIIYHSDGARGRRLVEEDSGDHLQNELVEVREPMRENRPCLKSTQHAENASSVRGVQRDGEDQSEQAPEEAPEMSRRRQRAPQVPRHNRRLRLGDKRVDEPLHGGEVLRLPDHTERVLGEAGEG